MSLPPSTPGWGTVPPPVLQPVKPRRTLLMWILSVVGVLVAFLMWQCGTALYEGAKKSDVAVSHFHELLNNENYEQICTEADPAFQASDKKEELIKFLSAVHRKLGRAGEAKRGTVNVNANTNGTFVSVDYQTQFDKGPAQENFTFKKTITGELKLLGYHIQSSALVLD